MPDELEVLGPDRGDERERRPRDRAQLRDLPEPAHPHLRHEHARLRLEPEHGQRQAELVVAARVGRDGRRHGGAERRERVLRRRLSRRADDGDDVRVRRVANEPGQRRERRLLVGRDERRRPACERVVDEPRAGVERDEEVAGTGVARVVVDAPDHAVCGRTAQLAEPQRLDLVPRRAGSRDRPIAQP